jgi:cardiolipin synthase (CMP-forming)
MNMKPEFWTIPNVLSILRVVFVVPAVVTLFSANPDGRWWALFWIGLAVLTDKLDGDIARWTHTESEWGRILDPLADKVGIAVVAIAMLVKGLMPLWFVLVLLLRDLLILAGGLILKKKTGQIVPSNMAGKWAVGVIAGTLIWALVDASSPYLPVCFGLSLAMVLVSTVGYVKRYISIIGTHPPSPSLSREGE